MFRFGWYPAITFEIMIRGFILFSILATISCKENVYKFPDNSAKYNFARKIQGHPMLFFSKDDIRFYKQKAVNSHMQFAKRIHEGAKLIMSGSMLPPLTYEEFGARWNEKYGNVLPVLAMSYILGNNTAKTLDYITLHMDRMVSYRSWYVIGMELDEVPIGHLLLGFATAFDIIYNDLHSERQQTYIRKLKNVTELMHKLSLRRWWGVSYIQNHVATNMVSILTSSLVLRAHVPEAEEWIRHSVEILDKSFHLFAGILDGSNAEGVTYGSYASM